MYKLSVWEAYKNGYFQMLMGGQHVVRVFQISQVVVQWSKESESTVRAESILDAFYVYSVFAVVTDSLTAFVMILHARQPMRGPEFPLWTNHSARLLFSL